MRARNCASHSLSLLALNHHREERFVNDHSLARVQPGSQWLSNTLKMSAHGKETQRTMSSRRLGTA
jgi:hypothetical protein